MPTRVGLMARYLTGVTLNLQEWDPGVLNLVGKRVVVVANLKPAKLAGVLSEGMLLCAEDAEGNLSLMTPEKSMPSGAEIM